MQLSRIPSEELEAPKSWEILKEVFHVLSDVVLVIRPIFITDSKKSFIHKSDSESRS